MLIQRLLNAVRYFRTLKGIFFYLTSLAIVLGSLGNPKVTQYDDANWRVIVYPASYFEYVDVFYYGGAQGVRFNIYAHRKGKGMHDWILLSEHKMIVRFAYK